MLSMYVNKSRFIFFDFLRLVDGKIGQIIRLKYNYTII